MAAVCRFCLSEDHPLSSALISPCACSGSIQYLHVECLREWRRVSPNDEYKNRCMICHQVYNLPRRWPYESIGVPGFAWDNFLSNPVLMTFLTYYIHFSLHGFYRPILFLEDRIVLHFLYQSTLSKLLFYIVLSGISGLYAGYFWPRLRRLRSPVVFLRYVAPDLARFVVFQGLFLYLVNLSIFPFGVCYVTLLSFSRKMYTEALERMNNDGQI